jgi:hypothetical protein
LFLPIIVDYRETINNLDNSRGRISGTAATGITRHRTSGTGSLSSQRRVTLDKELLRKRLYLEKIKGTDINTVAA